MAIRVEFYASDQVAASSIVEFALSLGAVLQSYAEVAPPLKKRGPGRAKKAKRTGKRRVNGGTFVKCVTTENPFREGGARWLACDVIMKHRVPILYTSLVKEIDAASISFTRCPLPIPPMAGLQLIWPTVSML